MQNRTTVVLSCHRWPVNTWHHTRHRCRWCSSQAERQSQEHRWVVCCSDLACLSKQVVSYVMWLMSLENVPNVLHVLNEYSRARDWSLQDAECVPPVCCYWGILPPSWEHCHQLRTIISERPWGWNGQRYRRRPTDRAGPGHRCDLGQPRWSYHYICWLRLSPLNGMGDKLTGELEAGSVCWCPLRSVKLLQQWLDNGVLTAAWKRELLEWRVFLRLRWRVGTDVNVHQWLLWLGTI